MVIQKLFRIYKIKYKNIKKLLKVLAKLNKFKNIYFYLTIAQS